MAKMTRTWWGEKFLNVLAISMDSGRLGRGRAYSGPNRLLSFAIDGPLAKATVRGNVNPYFGVTKEPRYQVEVKLKPLSPKDWGKLIEAISQNAACLSQLLLNEMPAAIESVFARQNLHLLPQRSSDLISTCSCPDYASPCKHVAGVYYKLASLLDRDPMLLFQLRGMDPVRLQEKLADSPLGKALLEQRGETGQALEYHAHRYPEPQQQPLAVTSLKAFWQGQTALPLVEASGKAATPAVLVKKGGDYPAFWQRDNSFIGAMEALYTSVTDKNKAVL
ncbi:SWIM zinc finger family protein [Candidatus Thiothrix sp. Deng01]|uniref:SWIM zinc finger family protein n=1 Tax=Candidatus Thiothrix phosphatis TaxID=3112415 RepID=A0ABU6CWZ7_9GAMM|nr:SWIM zinc finger family protein [Candidatus Thiothrix sp. Deng01]MEB4591357.1 SWIM zinc finger family protein [Candidatus Thiothrix sp. Deng01]